VPVIYETSDNKALRIKLKTDLTESSNDLVLNNALSSSLFNRKGEIEYIKVFIDKGYLK
jgi:hypothetical protein